MGKEVACLRAINHPNVLRLIEVASPPPHQAVLTGAPWQVLEDAEKYYLVTSCCTPSRTPCGSPGR